ncbi:MAG: glycoside-pentoside-hexuronide (GPH):cation symporter [Clostridiales bacterium]|nr:glycoside-pentoside-hexuronide (GPH):cation symporter [Clostridiales bacterium]
MSESTATTQKLTFLNKGGFALGGLPEVMSSVLAAFLTMFYTDSIGMAAGAVGTMFLVSRVFDGVSDLIAGSLIDKTKTRWGKARPWLLWLSVPTGFSLALIFFIPANGSATAQMAYAFITYNLFTSVMYTMVACAKCSLMSLMTQSEDDRISLSKYNTIFGLGCTLIGCSITFPFVARMGGNIAAWEAVFAIYGFVTAVGLLTCFATSREYINPALSGNNGGKPVEKIGFKEGLALFFKNKYSIFALVVSFLVQFSVQINSASQTYFYTYSMNDQSLTTSMNLVAVIPMIIGCLVLPNLLLKRIGLKKMIYIGCAAHIIFSLGLGLAANLQSVPLLATSLALKNLSVGCLSLPVGILAANGIDYGEYKFHKRIDGIGSSVVSCATKIAAGISSACVGWVLQLTGYVANTTQSAQVITVISCFVMQRLLPVLLSSFCL